ncbi:MAG: S-adenosyl-methyltransferase [Bacteroidetes bacterium]|nr:S-adenosyl-methyltransferase [Bacteroidota bacterium]
MIKSNKYNPDLARRRDLSEGAKKSSSQTGVQQILGGSFLTEDGAVSLLPFLFFITFLAVSYIANIYYSEKNVRDINSLNRELKELRFEHITIKSKLMIMSRQSDISKKLRGTGIKESINPPYELAKTKSNDLTK